MAPPIVLGVASVAAAAILTASGSDAYAFLLPRANPVVVTLAIAVLGVPALRILGKRGWIDRAGTTGRAVALAVALGVALAVPTIVVDALGGFPPQINVRAPTSLLFYPSVAFVAESAFHAVPLALAAIVAGVLPTDDDRARRFGMVGAALPEPILQVLWGAGHSPAWAQAFVGMHLFAFNLIGIGLLARYGFTTVYLYRMGYYLVWHMVWGEARIHLLFGG